jgi:hypothetical protein
MRFNIYVDIQGSVFCFILISFNGVTISRTPVNNFLKQVQFLTLLINLKMYCQLKCDTETIILGDFNICMKKNNNSLGISFTNIMQLFGFEQIYFL